MDRETVIRLADESGFDVIPADQYMEQDQIADSGNLWITDRLERFAAAVEANCVPPGWKVVPIEPTDEVLMAMREWDQLKHMGDKWRGRLYSALIAAAPAPKEESTLICPRCKVDRFKEPCPGPMHLCPIKGEAQ